LLPLGVTHAVDLFVEDTIGVTRIARVKMT